MKQTIGFSQFCDSFSDTYKNNFSYEGKRALFDYLEEYEADAGTEIELDTVALCCEYTEYESFEEFHQQYDKPKNVREISDYTQVIEVGTTGRFIIQNY